MNAVRQYWYDRYESSSYYFIVPNRILAMEIYAIHMEHLNKVAFSKSSMMLSSLSATGMASRPIQISKVL